MQKYCELCGKVFITRESRRRYCSRSCAGKVSGFNKGNIPHNKGKKAQLRRVCSVCSTEFVARSKKVRYCSSHCVGVASGFKPKQEPWNKNKSAEWARHPRSAKTKEKIRKSLTGRKRPDVAGEYHYKWKGGITRKRDGVAWWRREVFRRDNYTCQTCGKKSRKNSGELEAHHKLPWADYPELRFDLSNGVTLCVTCHKKITFVRE